ncbi:MAG: hypothetical protein RRX95_07300, partial [Oscillospiraceae bacterium]
SQLNFKKSKYKKIQHTDILFKVSAVVFIQKSHQGIKSRDRFCYCNIQPWHYLAAKTVKNVNLVTYNKVSCLLKYSTKA